MTGYCGAAVLLNLTGPCFIDCRTVAEAGGSALPVILLCSTESVLMGLSGSVDQDRSRATSWAHYAVIHCCILSSVSLPFTSAPLVSGSVDHRSLQGNVMEGIVLRLVPLSSVDELKQMRDSHRGAHDSSVACIEVTSIM